MAVTTPATSMASDNDTTTLHQQFTLPLLLANRVLNSLSETESTRSEFTQISRQIHRLSPLLRSAVRLTSSPSIYHRPIHCISADVTKTLEKTLILVRKCNHTSIIRHLFLTITSSIADVKKVSNHLESSIADLQWLISLFDDDYQLADVSIPPIASNDPILAWVWSSIASLYRNSSDRVDSASHLASLARDNHRYRKVIVEEGAIPPLLRLLKDIGGSSEAQIAAANALCCLADDRERTRAIADELGIGVIVEVLAKSRMSVQVVVAELVARVAEVDPTAREEFGKENVFKSLIECLIMDLDMEDYKRLRRGGKSSFHSVVKNELSANKCNNNKGYSCDVDYQKVESSPSSENQDLNEMDKIKRRLKTNCALAIWRLCEGSVLNSQKIAEPKGLFCLSKIIETEKGELQLNCLMTIMEVAKVAESNVELRKGAWKPSSPPAKAVLDQLLGVIKEEKDQEYLIPAIKAIGCLARIFPAKETGVISSLVVQLGNVKVNVATEAAIALAKFACPDNHNCVAHSRTIIEFNGVPPLMKLFSCSDRSRMNGLVLLSYLSMHVGNNKALAEAGALKILENAVRSGMAQNPELREIFHRALHHLMLYHDGDHPHSHSVHVG